MRAPIARLPTRLSDGWHGLDAREPAPRIVDAVRRALRSAPLPATLDTLNQWSGIGRDGLRAALHVLECDGHVTMNRRGDTVFTFTETPIRPDAGNQSAPVGAAA